MSACEPLTNWHIPFQADGRFYAVSSEGLSTGFNLEAKAERRSSLRLCYIHSRCFHQWHPNQTRGSPPFCSSHCSRAVKSNTGSSCVVTGGVYSRSKCVHRHTFKHSLINIKLLITSAVISMWDTRRRDYRVSTIIIHCKHSWYSAGALWTYFQTIPVARKEKRRP